MGFLKKKQEEHISSCEYDEINLNHYALARNPVPKRNQLSALFVILKNKYPDAEYTINTTLKEFRIPEEFEAPEIMAIAKYFQATEWHVFIDEERYVDIDFDMLKVNGELDMIQFCKDSVKNVEKYKSDISISDFTFNKYSNYLWQKFLDEQYEKMINLGNRYLTYGDFYIYDDELDEYKITCKEDFDAAKNREYILMKSKLNEYRIVMIDLGLKLVIATELDDLEREYMSNLLKPEIDGDE